MQRRLGPLVIETIEAQSPKFTAPLLLIHGLWCTAAVWRQFMGYLAHFGWSCHAVNLRGHAGSELPVPIGRVRFADYLDDVRLAIAACAARPVVLGHDLGGLLALHCTATVPAVVALAPVLPQSMMTGANPALSTLRARLAMWRSRPLPVPRGRLGCGYFAPRAPEGMAPDYGTVARELTHGDLRFPVGTGTPQLVLAGTADAFSPPRDVERLARYTGATFRQLEGAGHALPWEPRWENRVNEIHRWLIQQLGESLLMMREEEEP